jgi:formylglycine-generating enzyme required for sulfatase activity
MAKSLAVGTLVNSRYRLLAPLGGGTFGDVWRAEDANLGRQVALKFLRDVFVGDARAVARFDGEAVALARLAHPNVVAVFDRGTWEDARYLVTELCAGAPLADWLASHREAGTLPEIAAVRDIFDQICAGVEAAHDLAEPGPMVHRDLKPANVMLAVDKRGHHVAKVLDFGVARLGDRRVSTDGSPMGTPLYMPPEQATASHGEVGPWSDVFSLGVMLLEMLTLEQTAPDEKVWWNAVQLGQVPRGARPGAPEAVFRVVAKALSAAPGDRFPDAGAVRAALAAAWDGAPSVPRPSGGRRGARAMARVAGASLLGGVLIALLIARFIGPRARAAASPGAAERPCPAGMIRIPGGTLAMGTPPGDGYDDERPQHPEQVASFCIDRTEVTVAAYRACVESGACAEPGRGARCNWGVGGRDDHPINCVGWPEARAFCEAHGRRLPREREWEMAARGAEGRVYPWGDAPPADRACWNGEDSDVGKGHRESTCPVGSHPRGRTPEGVEDMAGNVWEWVEDVYCPYLAPGCAEAARVNRGGAFSYGYATDLRAANRHRYAPTARGAGVGLRCAWSE